MLEGWRIGGRIGVILLAVALFAALDISTAFAQSSSCSQLYATLQYLSRNSDFRASDQTNDDLRALQAQERDSESAYIRGGCQQAQEQRVGMPPQCRGLARQILQQRAQVQRMSQSMANGSAVSQQREQVLQQIARFGCNQQGSRPRFFGNAGPDQLAPPRHRNFLEDLFGGGSREDDGYGDSYGNYPGQEQVEDPYADQPYGNTIRTVCVRLSDGYYWPISYSTVQSYVPQDAQTCEAECPGQQVDLYYYANPGQEPDQMINQEGKAYTSLPTAFAYRKQFDANDSCKPQVTTGQITVQDLGDGETRAMVNYGPETFPLPIRDPRNTGKTAVPAAAYAQANDIPLPRPRPSSTQAAAAPSSEPVVSAPNRTVKVGDKIVRIVGPDTPYAPATMTGNAG